MSISTVSFLSGRWYTKLTIKANNYIKRIRIILFDQGTLSYVIDYREQYVLLLRQVRNTEIETF